MLYKFLCLSRNRLTTVAISVSPVVPRASLAFAHCPFARRFLFPLQLLGACVLLQGRIQERIGCKQEALSNYWRALQLDPFCFEALICLVRLAALTYQQRARSLLSRSFTLTSIYISLSHTCRLHHYTIHKCDLTAQQARRLSKRSARASISRSTPTPKSLRSRPKRSHPAASFLIRSPPQLPSR